MPSSAEVAVVFERMIVRTVRRGRVVNGKRCLEFTGARSSDGYGNIKVGPTTMLAHRLAFLHRHGYLPPVVLHACDNPPCLENAHHVAGTQAVNLADARAKGRASTPPHPRGEANHQAKLTPAKVRRIRALCAAGQAQHRVGTRFGVSQRAVSRIICGHTWSHVA